MRQTSIIIALSLGLAACGGGGGGNTVELKQPTVVWDAPVSPSGVLPMVDNVTWDETAVRKVLHVFAFGGFASDAQISTWANMAPNEAIVEMLTLNPYNPKLSGTIDADPLNGTDRSFLGLAALWSGANSPLATSRRDGFKPDSWNGPQNIAMQAASLPGVNPVPHRLAMWELNYHLVANRDADVSPEHLSYYYNAIQKSLAARDPYQNTMAIAAESVAIAQQYKHYRNFYDVKNGVGTFKGNEDFAREFHQLFFGILGTRLANDVQDNYHEIVTIKNTAQMLTDMTVVKDGDLELTFGTARHYVGDLDIMHTTISGATAKEKILALAQVDITHPESLDNLPVMIVSGLADNNLSDANIAELRAYWASMTKKDILQFIRAYAISTQFHNPHRIKYWNPAERNLLYSNLVTLTQGESYANYYDPTGLTDWQDGYRLFAPEHNVFGHTTGEETAQSGDKFLVQFNRGAAPWRYARTTDSKNPTWYKDWGSIAPHDVDGNYTVQQVAEWLWQRFMADGLKNFGPLERLQLYAILAANLDAAVACSPDQLNPNYEKVYSVAEATSDTAALACRDMLGAKTMDLGSAEASKRNAANTRIGYAIHFMTALPFALVQEGR